ncbi:two-component response regulator [Tolypothrix tenuis PCC 7101]|uniref:Two-component response regulator n=1 Tax=Tolypothrix tenuis PCC 7101 TaxID=231146 RepID=A0A1Z4N040_9CYAN|nr:response regulator [Aulosira sp. FACHB-113]BAY99098.1 two-component response regulator [Tolypothrix tenuis PCC 7101]BAZ76979.1 two-component response regulator [Aulosira laxa NIES-50]
MKTVEKIAINTRKILLIDHELIVREVLELCLQDLANWDILTADSPLSGLEQAETERPDAIVLDIGMRGSFMFLQQLRSTRKTQAIPVVLLSANAKWLDPKFLQQYKISGIILKPFNPVTLPVEIAKLLNWDDNLLLNSQNNLTSIVR